MMLLPEFSRADSLSPSRLSGSLIDVEPSLVIRVELFYPSIAKFCLKVGRTGVRVDLHRGHRLCMCDVSLVRVLGDIEGAT